jgi:hypothetical protein
MEFIVWAGSREMKFAANRVEVSRVEGVVKFIDAGGPERFFPLGQFQGYKISENPTTWELVVIIPPGKIQVASGPDPPKIETEDGVALLTFRRHGMDQPTARFVPGLVIEYHVLA